MLTLITSLALATPPVTPDAEVSAPPSVEISVAPRFESNDSIRITGDANDVFAAGNSVTIETPVLDNAFVAGETVVIKQAVHGDLFAAGRNLRIDARVHGDVYAAGADIVVSPTGRVDGHFQGFASEIDIQGPVGSLTVGAGRVVINAPIATDAKVEAGELVFLANGKVVGDLAYTTPTATADVDEMVNGSAVWTQGRHDGEEIQPSLASSIASWVFWNGWSYVGKLLVGAVLLMLGGAAAASTSRLIIDKPSRSLGIGLAGFVLIPLLSVLACLFIVPLPLGVLGLLTFGVLLYVAQIVAAQAMGDLILRRFRPQAWGSPLLSIAVGLVPLVLFASLPWVGGLAWFAATVFGVGAIWMRTRELAAG